MSNSSSTKNQKSLKTKKKKSKSTIPKIQSQIPTESNGSSRIISKSKIKSSKLPPSGANYMMELLSSNE
jgi:hypothetical protein